MPVFEEFPYTNFHELNLDWIIQEIKKLRADFADFVGGHVITYADPIQWDILRTYPAYCIVLDSVGNAYMSLKEVPGGVNLNETDYWMQIVNFYNAVPQILENEGIKRQIRIKRHYRYYIDGVNGSDDNDGLTAATAFKTINKFLSLSEQYTEARAYIISAGTYIASDCNQISGFSMHLWSTVPGVKVLFTADGSNQVSFYNCHLNFRGVDENSHITFGVYPENNDGLLYFDNSNFSIVYATFDCNITFYGSSGSLSDTEFYRITGHTSHITFTNKTNIKNTNNTIPAMNFNNNSQIVIYGIFSNAELIASGVDQNSCLLYASGSTVFLGSVIAQALTNKYYYAINTGYSIVMCTDARLNTMGGNTVAGNYIKASYKIEPTDY